uniref:Abasic site processing protein HMCES n=2 Tax=Sinocyclocheilus grahami TaxID=75366 RepID=A0A672SYJ4_SINGR
MCGRTACTLVLNELSRAAHTDKYWPSYKSPQSFSPVLVSNRHFNKDAPVDECVLAAMHWDLVPAWFRENDPSKMQYNTSNCGNESLLEKKSYKSDQDDSDWTGWRLLTIAGLFDSWTPPCGGETLYTYTVITVDSSPNLQSIHDHDRMPAVLDREDEVRWWLDFGEVKSLEAMKLLQPKSSLTFHPISSLVNNSRNNSPECLQPVDPTVEKTVQPTASSKMMTSWLKTASPTKRKNPDEDTSAKAPEEKSAAEKQTKPAGPLLQWLLGSGSRKKPRT